MPRGSRFRAAGEPGVFYGADALPTACAELGYWRWRFLRDAPALQRIDAVAHTAFRTSIRVAAAIDLRVPPLARDRARWTDPGHYDATQALARDARAAGIGVIRYASVRDPAHGGWLLMVVDVPNGPPGAGPPHDYSSELWIVEADAIEQGPIAKVKTGLALRSQVHGAWVGRAKLDASQLK